MINKSEIEQIVIAQLDEATQFLVDITVSTSNKINVYIDGFEGVSIDDCIRVSRAIEGNYDRDVEDFELEVSTAGLDLPFKVIQQYEKNLENDVKVTDLTGNVFKGKLIDVSEEGFKIEFQKKIKLEGKKKKQLVTEQLSFRFDEIKSTKVEISFK